MKLFYLACFSTLLLVGCSSNKIVEIEDNNNYLWQQYMNEDEFNKLSKGLSYLQVVEIAGGTGELYEQRDDEQTSVYRWNDEILITQGYELTFVNDELEKMEIIERKGISKRKVEEKKPAVPGSN